MHAFECVRTCRDVRTSAKHANTCTTTPLPLHLPLLFSSFSFLSFPFFPLFPSPFLSSLFPLFYYYIWGVIILVANHASYLGLAIAFLLILGDSSAKISHMGLRAPLLRLAEWIDFYYSNSVKIRVAPHRTCTPKR